MTAKHPNADKAAELERQLAVEQTKRRALQYAVNSFIEAVKPLVDEEQSNG